jgi:hypothetical protein
VPAHRALLPIEIWRSAREFESKSLQTSARKSAENEKGEMASGLVSKDPLKRPDFSRNKLFFFDLNPEEHFKMSSFFLKNQKKAKIFQKNEAR